MRYLSADRVQTAVESLSNRKIGLEICVWLLLKRSGGTPGASMEFTSDDCARFSDEFFGIGESVGTPSTAYFNPFEADWKSRSSKTDWAIQTLFTQLERPNNKVRLFVADAGKADVERDGRTFKGRRMQLRADPEYTNGLSKMVNGQPIALQELAVWRYRREPLDQGATVASLVPRLELELQLTPAEKAAVFT